jgi:hypothetical protein
MQRFALIRRQVGLSTPIRATRARHVSGDDGGARQCACAYRPVQDFRRGPGSRGVRRRRRCSVPRSTGSRRRSRRPLATEAEVPRPVGQEWQFTGWARHLHFTGSTLSAGRGAGAWRGSRRSPRCGQPQLQVCGTGVSVVRNRTPRRRPVSEPGAGRRRMVWAPTLWQAYPTNLPATTWSGRPHRWLVMGALTRQARSSLGMRTSSTRSRTAAAMGMATMAPMTPSSTPPMRTAMMVSNPGTLTARPMMRGTSR